MVRRSILKQSQSPSERTRSESKKVSFDVAEPDTANQEQSQSAIKARQNKRRNVWEICNFLEWTEEQLLSTQTMKRAVAAHIAENRNENATPGASASVTVDLNDYKALPIEVILVRLYKLQVLQTGTKPTALNDYIIAVDGLVFQNGDPRLVIQWDNTIAIDVRQSATTQDVVNSDAYKTYVSQFLDQQKDSLQHAWNETYEGIDELEFSDAEALEQIRKFKFYHFLNWLIMLNIMLNGDEDFPLDAVSRIRAKVGRTIGRLPYYFRGLKQLEQIHDFETYINKVDNSKNLSVENKVDFETMPMDFRYTNDVIPSDGVYICEDPPMGCECTGETCSLNSEDCKKSHERPIAYTTDKLINVPQWKPVFECNKRCACSKECVNRVVQHGRQQPLCIFKTSNGSGWGVRAVNAIAKGEFVCEYVGEVIEHEETEERGKQYAAEGKTYLFDLDFVKKDNLYTVDATAFGNVSRFLNHSCDPNLGVYCVWVDCLNFDLPKLCFFALRPIKENEELTFDYVREWPIRKRRGKKSKPKPPTEGIVFFDCKCGATNCKKKIKRI